MAAIMRDATKPNLLQTLENTPVIVHAGPFGNIAHGNSLGPGRPHRHPRRRLPHHRGRLRRRHGRASASSTSSAGASGLHPDAAVVVATVRALKAHSGKHRIVAGQAAPRGPVGGEPGRGARGRRQPAQADREHQGARGIARRGHQRVPDRPPVRARGHSTRSRRRWAPGWRCAPTSRTAARERPTWPRRSPRRPRSQSDFTLLYPDTATLQGEDRDRGHEDLRRRRGHLHPGAAKQLDTYERNGFGHLPVCIAKTHLSISSDPSAQGCADRLDDAGPRGSGVGRRRLHLSDLRRHADHAGFGGEPGGGAHRHRRRRRDPRPLVTRANPSTGALASD